MTLRKTDYEAIAAAINARPSGRGYDEAENEGHERSAGRIAKLIADYCASRDPNFQRAKFLQQCGIETGE
jgi:hypothetical protein